MTLSFYKNKKILITGNTGFKGSWLTIWLNKLGAEVVGYALEPNTSPSMYRELHLEKICTQIIGNILDTEKLNKIFDEYKPEIVFHLAAQPLVRKSYIEPVHTYQTNVIGTLNVLEAARKTRSVKAFINVTTDKCYENNEKQIAFKEEDKLGGFDMYSSSKACSEILTSSYKSSFLNGGTSFGLASARAGNVIGGGDWAEDRLIPDSIKAINDNEIISLRNPKANRPWQFVLEPLFGYLLLAKNLYENKEEFSQAFNFGPKEESIITVEEIVKEVISLYEKGEYKIDSGINFPEAKNLTLNSLKAKEKLGWENIYSTKIAIKETVIWYKNFYKSDVDMYDFTINQINNFETISSACGTCSIKNSIIKKEFYAK